MKKVAFCILLIIAGFLILIEIYLKSTSYIYIAHYRARQNAELKAGVAGLETVSRPLAECSGLPRIQFIVKSGKDRDQTIDYMVSGPTNTKIFTITRGLYDFIVRNEIPIVMEESEFLKAKEHLPYMKIIISHELAHHKIEPTAYHTILINLVWPKIILQSTEDFAHTLGNIIYFNCGFAKN